VRWQLLDHGALYRVDRRSDQRDLRLFVFHGFHLLPTS
jgi:hypothetical protein